MRFFKRLFCFHYWVETLNDPSSYEKEWGCPKCGKRVIKQTGWLPLNYEGDMQIVREKSWIYWGMASRTKR